MTPLVLAVGLVVVLAFVVLAVARPTVALVTLVALDVSNINQVIADHIGISPYKPQLALAALVLLVMARRRMFRFAWSPVLLGLVLLFAGFCLSFISAADPVTSSALLVARGRDLFYFLVVFALILSTGAVRSVAWSAVLVLAALAGLTVVHEFVLHNAGDLFGLSRVPLTQEGGALTPRHAGTSSDVNFWARLLILFTPLCLSLLAVARGWWERVLWVGCSVALVVGVYLTQSRGGFIALFLGLVVWAALAGGRYRKSLLYVPVALLVLVPLTGIGSRLGTLSAITSSSTATADPSVVTRKRLQLDAWHMFLDRPLTGHGIGSYGTLFPSYDRLSNFYQPVDIVVAAHNFYLEQAADGGIFLLLGWGLFFGAILVAALRTRSIARAHGGRASSLLAVGLIGGLTGWLVASVFLHLSDFRALLLVAALAAALDVEVRKRAQQAAVSPPLLKRPAGTTRISVLVTVAVLSGVGLAGVLYATQPRYTNSATLAVLPASTAVDPSHAYQLDVVSRGVIVPTLAAALDHSITVADLRRQAGLSVGDAAGSDVAFTARQSRLGGSIVLTVTGDRQAVTDLGAAAVTLSKERVAGLRPSYELTGTMSGPTRSSSVSGWAIPALEVMLLAAATGAALVGERKVEADSDGAVPAQVAAG